MYIPSWVVSYHHRAILQDFLFPGLIAAGVAKALTAHLSAFLSQLENINPQN